jgi:curved DNA-binding protein CbpA
MADEDFYEILGVKCDADDAELRRAWKQLALKWHPDRAGTDTGFIFQRISDAYAVLSDPNARAEYDRSRGVQPPTQGRAPSVVLRRLSRPLDALLALGIAQPASDSTWDLLLEPQEAAEGGMVVISMRVPVRSASGIADEVYSAWLAIRPGTVDGTIVRPSAQLPGVVKPVAFRVRL